MRILIDEDTAVQLVGPLQHVLIGHQVKHIHDLSWKGKKDRDVLPDASVAEIAAAAGVAEKTVYNYFPVKAEMFFDEAGDVLAELLAAVRYRAAGRSALDAVGVFIAGRAEWAAGRRPEQPTSRFRQLIAGSTALQAQQRLMFARFETALAGLLAEQTGAGREAVEPFVAAVELVGVIRAAFEVSPAATDQAGTWPSPR